MAAETPVLYNVETWVEENQKYFLPPVCNKMMHNTQLKVRSKSYIPSTIETMFMLWHKKLVSCAIQLAVHDNLFPLIFDKIKEQAVHRS